MIHQAIKKARKEAKLTQEQLSKRTGIPTRRIIAIESGKGILSLPELEHLSKCIGVKILLLPSFLLD